jgi:hypothetical protein
MARRGVIVGLSALVLTCVSGTALAQGADNCADATVSPPGTYAFDTTAATVDGTATCGLSAGSPDVWFKVTAGVAGNLAVTTCNLASFDTVLSAFDSCGGNQLACNDDACGLQSRISFPVAAGQTVLIRVCGLQRGTGAGSVDIIAPQPPLPGTLFEAGGDAGELLNTAQVASGATGNLPAILGSLGTGDSDLYKIGICEPANFSASLTNADTTFDTQIFLFDANGTGIVMNDDAVGLQSALTNALTSTLPTGDYYLAVSQYDRDPTNAAAAEIWLDMPFAAERAPDGAAAALDYVIAGWTAGAGAGGGYRINLTGACYPGPSSNCVADVDDGSGTGEDDGAVTIDDLLYFLAQFEAGGTAADIDNGTATGTTDGAVTIDDLLYFLVRFEEGC